MTQPLNSGYESTNREYLDNRGHAARDRKRVKRCADDRAELVQGVGDWLHCPVCQRTADELAQVIR
jgi:hypothetical protein